MDRRHFLTLALASTATASLWSRQTQAVPPGTGTEQPVQFAEGEIVPTLDEISATLSVS